MPDALQKVSQTEFAQAIKAKYPVYAEVPDLELTSRILDKYPVYRERVSEANFSTSNEMDMTGQPAVATDPAGSGVLGFVGQAGRGIDPIAAVKTIASALRNPQATGQAVEAIASAQGALFDKAKAAYQQGDYVTAGRHFVNYLLPIIGPGLDESSDLFQAGKWAAGGGKTLGIALSLFGPQALNKAAAAKYPLAARPTPAVPVEGRLTPQDAASNAFARERDIPLDAATATGSRSLRAMQKRVANSMGGEGTADDLIRGQHQALGRVGGELAEDVRPGTVTPEQAGTTVKEGVRTLMGDLNAQASEAYARLRALEAHPDNAVKVPKPLSRADTQAIRTQQMSTLGFEPSPELVGELRRMAAELDNLRFTKRTWNWDVPRKSGNAAGGDADIVAGAAGAPVFHDILEATGSNTKYTRGEMLKHLNAAIDSGHYSKLSKAAIDVARRRLEGDQTVSWPSLPPDAGAYAKSTEYMPLAVDVGKVKPILKPLYDSLKREGELVPLMGDRGRALVALDRLMTGPDHAPVSVVDGALGDLKSMARADVPELRTQGQGAAAFAVKHLDDAVRQAVTKAGPEALAALEEGRAATKAKYLTGETFQVLGDEPVKVFRQLTAPKDSGIALLRKVQEAAPGRIPDLARAKLEEWLTLATERGAFDHADRLYAEWQKLGPETKKILFRSSDQIQALDRFFLLAKRIRENPNPSGTAHTLTALNVGSQPVMYGLAKLLYTPSGVRALTRLLDLDLKAAVGPVGGAARQAAWIGLANVAKAEGVTLPKAAEDQ